MNTTVRITLKLIPDSLQTQPVFLCVDDTMVSKFGTKFENVSKLFDHAAQNSSNYLNGHCFVSIMLCVPVLDHDKISYLFVPLGYRMWQKKESKLELAAAMIRKVMSEFQNKKHVIILCDSWYTKQNLVCIVKEYPNLDLIGNARIDSAMYDLAPARTGHFVVGISRMEVIAHMRTSNNDRRSHRYDTGISNGYVINFYCPLDLLLCLKLACDTNFIIA